MKTSDLNQVTVKRGYTQEFPAIEFFTACQYRWEDSADPERDDEKSFVTLDEAIAYADSIKCEIGFYPIVERVTIHLSDFEEDEEFELDELSYESHSSMECEHVYAGKTNSGDEITGAILVEWAWEKHVGYCRDMKNIGVAGEWPFHEFKTEQDLISGNEERTFHSNFDILLTAAEVAEAGDLEFAIEDALNASSWKWNYFRNNPNSAVIQDKIREIVE